MLAHNDDMVLIPLRVYKELLHYKAKKPKKTFLDEALEEVNLGKITGPFTSTKSLMKSLQSSK
jgi:hypothetical protein